MDIIKYGTFIYFSLDFLLNIYNSKNFINCKSSKYKRENFDIFRIFGSDRIFLNFSHVNFCILSYKFKII